MKRKIFFILILFTFNISGQTKETENLINQIANDLVPDNFDYYYINPVSLKERINDSLQYFHLLKLKLVDKEFPIDLAYTPYHETTNWKEYNLKNVKFPSDEYHNKSSPPNSLEVKFIRYNIPEKTYDSLVAIKTPHTLLVKKKWYWNKNKIWTNNNFRTELYKAWEKDKKINIEEKVYFNFSKPLFSNDKKYARVSVEVIKRCNGYGFTAIYAMIKGKWKNLIEYNETKINSFSTHRKCEEIMITIRN